MLDETILSGFGYGFVLISCLILSAGLRESQHLFCNAARLSAVLVIEAVSWCFSVAGIARFAVHPAQGLEMQVSQRGDVESCCLEVVDQAVQGVAVGRQ